MKCPFCLGDGKKTREHLFSNAVFDSMGLDRAITVASVNPDSGSFKPLTSLDNRSVRLPCGSCNSGWMSALEGETADVLRRWTSPGNHDLTVGEHSTLTRWLVKTMIVLTFSELRARNFMEEPTATAIPDITSARAVADGRIPDLAVVGAARVAPSSSIVWSVGNADVQPVGPDAISSRAVNVAVVTLGVLKLWIALPLIKPDRLNLPQDVRPLLPGTQFSELPTNTRGVSPTRVKVWYSAQRSGAF